MDRFEALAALLAQRCGTLEVRNEEPMSRHTTFRIGGPADCLVYLENEEQLCKIQKYLRLVDVPYTVIGNGSNLLVGDKGFRGTIISTERLAELEVQKNEKKPFRQIAATPLPHYKSLRRERGVVWRGEREALLQKVFPLQVSYSSNTRLRMSPAWRG